MNKYDLPYYFLVVTFIILFSSAHAGSSDTQNPIKNPFFYGTVLSNGEPVKAAMLTFYHGDPVHSLSIYADEQGRFLSPELPWTDGYKIRVRRVGRRDVLLEGQRPSNTGTRLNIEMDRIADTREMIGQLPSNYWMNLVLDEIPNREQLLEFKAQCTSCHQQGSPFTSRGNLTREQWADIIYDMELRGAILTDALKEKLPDYYLRAYDEANVHEKLPRYDKEDGPLPIPSREARRAVIEEWDLGGTISSHHDMMIHHPTNTVWSVDGPTDTLYKISFEESPDGERTAYAIPKGDHQPGGVYYKMGAKSGDSYLAPHSLQTAPNDDIWLTLASGNQLAGFDPETEQWDMVDLNQGINPHTLRFDRQGRIWFTLSATNHVGMYDPITREQKYVRLPAPDLVTSFILQITPFLIAHADWFNLREQSAKQDGLSMPVPYGIDISPMDGSVWYSQLNMDHIGKINPETLEVTSIPTPFTTPRRLRFDSKGNLWVPSYAEGTINRFNTRTMQWENTYVIPVEPSDTEVPYAVFVDQSTDEVWITGTQSDSLIRFKPETEEWIIYPLPTRVTYTRDVDIDDRNHLWTSHSSSPTWHIEGGYPKITSIDPDGAPDIEASGLFLE